MDFQVESEENDRWLMDGHSATQKEHSQNHSGSARLAFDIHRERGIDIFYLKVHF